jgi:RNA polymerase sigma-70 factor, ECF subfamily
LNPAAETIRRDQAAFERLIGPHRAALQAHCYRMLGSAADAEDALQETLLRAWRGLSSFEGRSSLRSWLYRIATNVCLKMIERRPKRVLPIDYGPASDPHDCAEAPDVEGVWLDPYPDEELGLGDSPASPEARYEQRESVELAFIAALQHLPGRQRAVLLLRDVLEFSPGEIAKALDATPASVSSALQRARHAAAKRMPVRSQQATLRSIGDERLREAVERYVRAWERDDVAAIAAMLTDDATFSMPPQPTWHSGRAAVAAFLAAVPCPAAGAGGTYPSAPTANRPSPSTRRAREPLVTSRTRSSCSASTLPLGSPTSRRSRRSPRSPASACRAS